MRAKWRGMTHEERIANSNIEQLKAAAKTPRVRRLLSAAKMGDANPMRRPEVAQKVSVTLKAKWGSRFSAKMKDSWRRGAIKPLWSHLNGKMSSPNKMEQVLAEILLTAAPDFKYAGNAAFWIGPCMSGKHRNPDWVDKQARKVILLHGEYWHSKQDATTQTEDYETYGWAALTIWSKELQIKRRPALLMKLRTFVASASSVVRTWGVPPYTT